jgi:uncharacterized membrane protein (DUF4010 family)
VDESWIRLAASLGIGLLIGLERERNPAGKAGARTFALVALLGTLSVMVADAAQAAWTVPVGLASVSAMLIVAYARVAPGEDPGTTTVAAAAVCFLLGVLAGTGETVLAGALAICVTGLLYFKPEIEGMSVALSREQQVSLLQFLVVTFIVLPILPDRSYGPYGVLNPRDIWLMVVLISGIGLASYVALRIAGERHGGLLAGVLGGLVSSTATTVLYARRSRESEAMERLARSVVPLANLVPLLRIAVVAAVLQPGLLRFLLPVILAALTAGAALTALSMRHAARPRGAPLSEMRPEMRNPAELGTALKFGGFYALVLLGAAWLSDLAGERGLYAAALASGLVDIDAITLSSLNLYGENRIAATQAVLAVALAYAANLVFKLGVLAWFNPALALRVVWPLAATVLAGGAMLLI